MHVGFVLDGFDVARQSGASGTARAGTALSPSDLFKQITWHWDTLATGAYGSDLWSVTWGPDDPLYVAWGDGGGFGGSDSDGRVAMGIAVLKARPSTGTA